jgi:GAF domain-containing protein
MTPEERLLRAIGLRAEAARRLEGSAAGAVLRSVVEATVALFDAEAASIALFDPATGRLVFEVAAGEQGQGVIGLTIAPDQGIAGYAFTTGQALAVSDVERDARFGRATAERTGYVPRSIVAVPLVDEHGTIGVLQVLDKRSAAAFSLRDVELAGVFARQASVAIRASRVERDTAALLAAALRRLADTGGAGGAADDNAARSAPSAGSDAAGVPDGLAGDAPADADAALIDALVARAVADLGRDDDSGLWRLADRVARLRDADPASVDLLADLLDVLIARSERDRALRRGRTAPTGGNARFAPLDDEA